MGGIKMTTLKDSAIAYEKKDIFSLDRLPVDAEIQEGSFEKNGQAIKYSFIEFNGWKYTIRPEHLAKLKQTIEIRPDTKFVKFKKDDKGSPYCVPVD